MPDNYAIGDSLEIMVTRLIPYNSYIIIADKIDRFGRKWKSDFTFEANASGRIKIRTQDVDHIFWSMTMPEPSPENWQAPAPQDYAIVQFSLVHGKDTLQHISTKQFIIPQGVKRESINEGITAELFHPQTSNIKDNPTILVLGGSGGGLSWASRMAALLANEGYNAMALSYFNSEGLPKNLAQIPLEYVDQAIEHLNQRKNIRIDNLGVIGYSKGAELGLLMASHRPVIKCIVAIAPGSAVFQGFKPPKFPTISSWSLNGKDVPFVPNAYDKRFFESYDGMYLWYRTLDQYDAFESAAIPVENINGNILLLSGVKDKIWPATFMGEQIIKRLHIAEFGHNYNHMAFPEAGHGIAEPPGHSTIALSNRLGGTPAGNAEARRKVWKEIKKFLDKSLDNNEG